MELAEAGRQGPGASHFIGSLELAASHDFAAVGVNRRGERVRHTPLRGEYPGRLGCQPRLRYDQRGFQRSQQHSTGPRGPGAG